MALEIFHVDGAHSAIRFSVRHMLLAHVRGTFRQWSATLRLDEAAPGASSVEATLEAASIETGVPERDVHLRSPDFLHARKYPVITYRSRQVEALGGKRYRVIGDLVIRDVSREIPLEVEYAGRGHDPWGHERVGLAARATIVRSDYGLIWNQVIEGGGVLVGDKIDVEIDIEAVKETPATGA